jgi:hypothetical protein
MDKGRLKDYIRCLSQNGIMPLLMLTSKKVELIETEVNGGFQGLGGGMK